MLTVNYDLGEEYARALDAADPLAALREEFHIPTVREIASLDVGRAGVGTSKFAPRTDDDLDRPCIYLTGNSLGCMPRAARAAVVAELDDWERLGVEGHLHGRHPWLPYHEFMRETAARLVGAMPHEAVIMNSLTVNLHLLMVSFYRPTASRYKIVIEDTAFPSDSYAVSSQAAFHGYDPAQAIVRLRPREGEQTLRDEDIVSVIEREGERVALVMLGGVNYLTGQWFDMARITTAAQGKGCVVGWDLAHAAGNVPLRLHEWGVDFAAWCSYKYLNAGPGAIAGAFVHERHTRFGSEGRVGGGLPRFAGWWGTDPATRFQMGPEYSPVASADAWQLSNPPILSMAPVRASLELFDRVGMDRLREKSERLTGYLEWLLKQAPERSGAAGGEAAGSASFKIITPSDPARRGCALSIAIQTPGGAPIDGRSFLAKLRRLGVVCDFRYPNVIRAAPVPFYTTYHDVWRFASILREVCSG